MFDCVVLYLIKFLVKFELIFMVFIYIVLELFEVGIGFLWLKIGRGLEIINYRKCFEVKLFVSMKEINLCLRMDCRMK